MKNFWCVLVVLWVDCACAKDISCDLVERISSDGQTVYERSNLTYYSPASKLVFYKENVTTKKNDRFTLTPVLHTKNKSYLLDLDWDNEDVRANDMPTIDVVSTMDFNKNGFNELVIITKREVYLGEFSTVGFVMHAMVAPDEKTLLSDDSCVIEGYPFINEHLAAIRTAKVNGVDTCEERFCNTQQVLTELKRIQKLSAEEFMTEAHKLALSLFKGKMNEMAARIASAALIYPGSLSDNTVNNFNDMGFFKEQAGQYNEAVEILERVAEKYPNRAVVYLNLGDAYVGLERFAQAETAYIKYVELMRKEGKERKIPKRVLEILKSQNETTG